MNTFFLILIRLFNKTFGYIPGCAQALKKILIGILITGKTKKYVAASRYFDWKKFIKKERNGNTK